MPHERHLSLEGALGICFAVDAHDELAAPPEKLVDPHVFDVPSVREVQPCVVFGHPGPCHFTKQAGEAWRTYRRFLGMTDPETEADVQQSQYRRERRHRAEPHLRRSRSA